MAQIDAVDALSYQEWRDDREEKSSSWNGRAVLLLHRDEKVERIATGNGPDVSGRVDFEVRWGGTKEPEYSVGVGITVEDKKGNSAEVEVRHHSDGSNSAKGTVEHEPDDT